MFRLEMCLMKHGAVQLRYLVKDKPNSVNISQTAGERLMLFKEKLHNERISLKKYA